MIRGIRHTGIYVQDLEKMRQFYCENFHMHVVVHGHESGNYIDGILGKNNIRLELYKLTCDNGGMLELLKMEPMMNGKETSEIYEKGCMHIAFTVDSVVEKYRELLKENIKFISAPHISDDGKANVCFCQDPEGNYLELVEELMDQG